MRKDINGAGARGRRVRLISVRACGRAGLIDRAHGESTAIAAHRKGIAELVAVVGTASIRGLEVSLLQPCGPGAREEIHRAGVWHGCVFLVAVDTFGPAVL